MPKAVVAVGRYFVFAGANRLDPANPHQPANAALAHIKPSLFQLHRHPGTAITAQAQTIRLADVRQDFHVAALPCAHWTCRPGTKASRRNLHHTADRLHLPNVTPLFHEREPNDFWLAKNWVAFLRNSNIRLNR